MKLLKGLWSNWVVERGGWSITNHVRVSWSEGSNIDQWSRFTASLMRWVIAVKSKYGTIFCQFTFIFPHQDQVFLCHCFSKTETEWLLRRKFSCLVVLCLSFAVGERLCSVAHLCSCKNTNIRLAFHQSMALDDSFIVCKWTCRVDFLSLHVIAHEAA